MKKTSKKASKELVDVVVHDNEFESFDYFGLGAPEIKEETMKKDEITPFVFLDSVNKSKIDLIKTADQPEEVERKYNPYMINRGLSYFPDTVLHANEMNRLWHLPKDAQYRYYLMVLRPRDRRSKWFKTEKNEELDLIQAYFQCNRTVAKQFIKILSEEDLQKINNKMNKGSS